MNNKKEVFIIKDENDNDIECELLFSFKDEKTNRDFIVFTSKKDEDGDDIISAGILKPDGQDFELTLVSDDKDWDLVDEKLKEKYGEK